MISPPFEVILPQQKSIFNFGGDTVSIEEKKQEIKEMAEVLNGLSRDDLMKTYGFALGLKAQDDNQPG
jgi:hypothetical protein